MFDTLIDISTSYAQLCCVLGVVMLALICAMFYALGRASGGSRR